MKGVKTIFVINHMSEPWVNHAPVLNKYVVRGSKVFGQLCICALILVPPDIVRGGQPPVPSALVAKEALAIRRWDSEQYVTQRALPMRIPVPGGAHIHRHLDEPADFTHPAAGETWSEFELNAYGDWLSEEQVQWALSVQSYEEGAGEVVRPQPTIAEVKLTWIAELTKVSGTIGLEAL